MKFDKWMVTFAVLAGLTAQANSQPINDPAIHGMQALPRVEGCNAPGGLQPITSSAGPNEAQFWCGTPPVCLTLPVGNPGRCHIIQGTRNGGSSGVRNPQDLQCDTSGVNPTEPTKANPGRCPLPPQLQSSLNSIQVLNIQTGQSAQLRVFTLGSDPMMTPTSLTMSCAGPHAGIYPFNQTNLIGIAGTNHSYSPVLIGAAGTTNCTIFAATAAGSLTQTVRLVVTVPAPPPPPPSACPAGGVRYQNGVIDIPGSGGWSQSGPANTWFMLSPGLPSGNAHAATSVVVSGPNVSRRITCRYVCYQSRTVTNPHNPSNCPNTNPRTSWAWIPQ